MSDIIHWNCILICAILTITMHGKNKQSFQRVAGFSDKKQRKKSTVKSFGYKEYKILMKEQFILFDIHSFSVNHDLFNKHT